MQHWILKWCRCFFQAIDGRSREKPWTKDEFLTAAAAATGLPTSTTCHTSTPTRQQRWRLEEDIPLFHQFLNFLGPPVQRVLPHAQGMKSSCIFDGGNVWLWMLNKNEKRSLCCIITTRRSRRRTWEHLLMPARNSHHHHKTREHASKQCNHGKHKKVFFAFIFLFHRALDLKIGLEKVGKNVNTFLTSIASDRITSSNNTK